jgi:hypothetical protein
MKTPARKQFTHCDQYGHTWEASTIEGYERCSHVGYSKNGKPVFCEGARRIGVPTPPPESVVPQRSCSAVSVADQVPLWEA